MTVLVIPAARDGRIDGDALSWLTGRFVRLSQAAPIIMLLTGGYMASQGVITASPLRSLQGQLVVTMVALWIALSGLSNVASQRLTASIETNGIEQATNDSMLLFSVAGVVALALLLVGGWL